jgi:membrane associated rhomboid family serine protease
VNLAAFVLLHIFLLFIFFFKVEFDVESLVVDWLGVPAAAMELIYKPWTVLTYQFLHVDLWHIFSNMIMLYFGGVLFMEYLDTRKLVITYVLGGIFGAVLYVIAYNLFPVFEPVVNNSRMFGASASVLAIITAIATFVPNYVVNLLLFGRVKLKYIAVIFIILDLLSIPKGNAGGHIAHLGGAIYGYLFIVQYKRGNDWSLFFSRIINFFQRLWPENRKSKMTVAYKKPVSDEDYNLEKNMRQQKIDEILDKISKSGYDSLNKKEKEILFKMSNKN